RAERRPGEGEGTTAERPGDAAKLSQCHLAILAASPYSRITYDCAEPYSRSTTSPTTVPVAAIVPAGSSRTPSAPRTKGTIPRHAGRLRETLTTRRSAPPETEPETEPGAAPAPPPAP